MVQLALLPEPRPKARNLPTRYGARGVGAQANRIRLQGQLPLFRAGAEWIRRLGGRDEQEFRQAEEAAKTEAAKDAQGAPQREARSQEVRLRPPSSGRSVEPETQSIQPARWATRWALQLTWPFPEPLLSRDLTGRCAEGGGNEVPMQVLSGYSARFRKWLGQLGKKQSPEAP